MWWISEDTWEWVMALARHPGTAGLALLLLAGAQGRLSGQHNLGAERGAQGHGRRSPPGSGDAPLAVPLHRAPGATATAEPRAGVRRGQVRLRRWFVLAAGGSGRAGAKTNAGRGPEPEQRDGGQTPPLSGHAPSSVGCRQRARPRGGDSSDGHPVTHTSPPHTCPPAVFAPHLPFGSSPATRMTPPAAPARFIAPGGGPPRDGGGTAEGGDG